MKLEEIADPTRLKVGDLMLVPSEREETVQKLHVSLNTLAKRGLSLGFTSRSDNSEENVRMTLAKDTGKTRTYWVERVSESYAYSSNDRKYRDLVGNSGAPVPTIPRYRMVNMLELPAPDMESELRNKAIRRWCTAFDGRARKALSGKLLASDITCEYSPATDGRMTTVFESSYSRDVATNEFIPMSYENYLPIGRVNGYDGNPASDRALTDEEIGELILGEPFTEDMTDVPHFEMRPRFALNHAKAGARFLRPDDEFLDTVTRFATSELMRDYAHRQIRVAELVSSFTKGLKKDMDLVGARVKRGTAASRSLMPTAKTLNAAFARLS